MRRIIPFLVALTLLAACGGAGLGSGGDSPVTSTTSTTISPDQPVDSGGSDQPVAQPGPVGSIPEPRPPIDGSINGEVTITKADLLIMESYPIQVSLQVEGEKPTPCHEIFWTVEDDGETIEITMISQVNADQSCAQVIAPFAIAVPIGSWAEESRQVVLNGENVGSFNS